MHHFPRTCSQVAIQISHLIPLNFNCFERFAAEIEDIFCGPVFAQLMASCVIICMTCFLMANNVKTVQDAIGAFSYLVTMVIQILLFCWIGNELIYSVSSTVLLLKAFI
jgi:hypothetical protein